jgi:peptidoglycan/xylan/chitin deacetylase (PgdA/CDA1 family)
LTALPLEHARAEISGSRDGLAQATAAPIRTFAYPFGDCSDAIIDQVAEAGFVAACCSRSGIADPASPLFALPRVEVRGTDSILQFVRLVRRGHRHDSRRTGGRLEAMTT